MEQNNKYTLGLGFILGVLSAVLFILTGAWRALPASIMGTSYSSAPILMPIYTNPILNVSSTPSTFMGAPTMTSTNVSSTPPIFVTTPTTTTTVSSMGMGVEMCTDGTDNDGDMEVDCDDSDCMYSPACHPSAPPPPTPINSESYCGNNIDDDMDGSMDCDDSDCLYACMNGSTNSTGMQVAPTVPLIPAPTSTVSVPTLMIPAPVLPSFWQDASEEPGGSYIDPFYTPLIDDTYLEPYNSDLVPEAVINHMGAGEPMTEEAVLFRKSFVPFLQELLKWFKF